MQENEEPPSPSRRRSRLPALAPRHLNNATRDRSSGSASGSSRPPRLSHRSRQGCWTCRARKVKCDEVHPKCGPCARLNRDCDWDHRWNFSNATTSTQVKYSNVKTTGNAVWDPEAKPSRDHNFLSIPYDDLPAFHILTTDEERERKAESQRPGTYGVVVTPESFSELPEYAAASPADTRRLSLQSHSSNIRIQTTPSILRPLSRAFTDPDVVVLERFEDVSPTSAIPFLTPSSARRPSVPDSLQYLSLTSTPLGDSILESSPITADVKIDESLISHFRRYVVNRLIQPQIAGTNMDALIPGSTRDIFEVASARFPALHHAICALSALSLAYSGGSTIEEALQHYHQALSSLTTASSTDDLSSRGVFLRHFLLLIFDICFTIPNDTGGTDTWTIHLNNLRQSALMRHQQYGSEPHAYLLWRICELDTYACLMGSGNCDFLRTVIRENMLPPLEQQIPLTIPTAPMPYLADEMSTFPDILALNQLVVIQAAYLAQAAQGFRGEALEIDVVGPGVIARWVATVSQLQTDLLSYWTQRYPPYLDPDPSRAAGMLTGRVKYVFEHALTVYHAAIIYSRTSMFPGQRRIPVANQLDVHTDMERRVLSIIAIATAQLEEGHFDRRHIIFPLFMAGFATSQPDAKIQALDLIRGFEGWGIGQNTSRTRQLLKVVYEEQGRRVDEGGSMEDVDWLTTARRHSLAVVNCGL